MAMKKLFVNNRKHLILNRSISVFIQLAIIFGIGFMQLEQWPNFYAIGSIVTFLGLGLILMLNKSHFLYRILERTDHSTLTFYNNFFGLRLNSLTVKIDAVEHISTFQDPKNYYIIDLQLRNGTTFQLGRFEVKSDLTAFENHANDLIKT